MQSPCQIQKNFTEKRNRGQETLLISVKTSFSGREDVRPRDTDQAGGWSESLHPEAQGWSESLHPPRPNWSDSLHPPLN